MHASIRRNTEGITFLVLEPSNYVTETMGLTVLVGNTAGDFIPHTAYAVPIYEPGLAADQVIPGGPNISFTVLPDGVTKAGFPAGSDSQNFNSAQLRSYLLSGLYDIAESRADAIVGLYEEFTNTDTKGLKSEVNLTFWEHLIGRPEIACMLPGIFEGFIASLDSDVEGIEGLDAADKERFHDLSKALASERNDAKQIYITPSTIKVLWKVLPDYVIAPSETLRRVKAIVGVQLMAALSSASCFSKLHSATERDIDKVIDALV